jgi:hypothetical protein
MGKKRGGCGLRTQRIDLARAYNEEMIQLIIKSQSRQVPKFVKRIAIGICNEVYRVGLEKEEVIARLSAHDRFLMGSHDHIPQFKALGIPVPDIFRRKGHCPITELPREVRKYPPLPHPMSAARSSSQCGR